MISAKKLILETWNNSEVKKKIMQKTSTFEPNEAFFCVYTVQWSPVNRTIVWLLFIYTTHTVANSYIILLLAFIHWFPTDYMNKFDQIASMRKIVKFSMIWKTAQIPRYKFQSTNLYHESFTLCKSSHKQSVKKHRIMPVQNAESSRFMCK